MKESAVKIVNDCEQLSISFQNLCFSVKTTEKVEILKNLSGSFQSGRLCAIVGPTGAGKTSLLNILSGFKKPTGEDCLFVNGKSTSGSFIRKNSSYISQEAVFLKNLTVWETLEYAAKFKLPADTLNTYRRLIIENIVEVLGLEKCRSTRVEKLSGGEQKRLSIAEELLTNPPIMIFDEPTSGLDSASAAHVVSHLKDLAHAGRTIVCVIHQPSSFVMELFDDIYVLSDGQCLYCGPVDDIVTEFKEAGFVCPQYYNRADFIIEVASYQRKGNHNHLIWKVKEKDWTGLDIEESNMTQFALCNGKEISYQKDENFAYSLSKWMQFFMLLRRNLQCIRREFVIFELKLGLHIFSALVYGYIFYGIGNDANKVMTNISLLFLLMFSMFFANSMSLILLYPLEAKLFYKEHLNNRYAFVPYFWAKIIADIPFHIIGTYLTILPIFFLSHQPYEWKRILLVGLFFFLMSIISVLYGFFVGIVFDVKMGIVFLPASFMLLLIFSGYFIRFRELPMLLKPMYYLTFFSYIFDGIFQSIYGYGRKDLQCDQLYCHFKYISKVLEEMGMEGDNFVLDISGSIAWIVGLLIASFVALKIRYKQQIK